MKKLLFIMNPFAGQKKANKVLPEILMLFTEAGYEIQIAMTTGSGSEMFKIGPLKLLGDGALGARTAFLSRPYADEPGTRGLSVFTGEQFD